MHWANCCCLCCLAAPFIGPFGQFADPLEVNFVFLVVDIYGVLYGQRVGIWSAEESPLTLPASSEKTYVTGEGQSIWHVGTDSR